MQSYGAKLIVSYLNAPNETLRDISSTKDIRAIVAVLEKVEDIHRAFLELLIDLSAENDPCYYYETTSSITDYDENPVY